MIATSLAIAPATATWGSGTIASDAFMWLNLLRSRCGSSLMHPLFQHRASGLIPILGIAAHMFYSESGSTVHPRSHINERRTFRLGAPERHLGGRMRSHENPQRILVGSHHGRDPVRVSPILSLESGAHIDRDHRLTRNARRHVERHDSPQPSVPIASPAGGLRGKVEREGATGTEDVDQWRVRSTGPEEEELTTIEIHHGDSERAVKIGEPPGREKRLDGQAQRGRAEEPAGEEAGHGRERIAHDSSTTHLGQAREQDVFVHS
jgi:hypothetical protein